MNANGRNKCQLKKILSNLIFFTDATSANNSQHCLRCCWPTMLHLFAWAWKFDRFQTICNKCQQVLTLLWFHANGHNKSQHCWAQQCWVLLANNVGSVCTDLKITVFVVLISEQFCKHCCFTIKTRSNLWDKHKQKHKHSTFNNKGKDRQWKVIFYLKFSFVLVLITIIS